MPSLKRFRRSFRDSLSCRNAFEADFPLRFRSERSGPPGGVGRVREKGADAGEQLSKLRRGGENILTIGLLPVAGTIHSRRERGQHRMFIWIGERNNRKKARNRFGGLRGR